MTKKPKLSDWISGDIKPQHVGVYQRDYGNAINYGRAIGVAYSHWNGKRWGIFDPTVRGAKFGSSLKSVHQRLPWRGLAENPSEK